MAFIHEKVADSILAKSGNMYLVAVTIYSLSKILACLWSWAYMLELYLVTNLDNMLPLVKAIIV